MPCCRLSKLNSRSWGPLSTDRELLTTDGLVRPSSCPRLACMCEGDRNHGLASIVFPGLPDCQPLEWPPIPPRCNSLPTAGNPRHRVFGLTIPPRRQYTLPPGPRRESHRGILMAPQSADVQFPRRAYEPPSSTSPNMNSPLSFGWILRLAHLASAQRFFVSSQLSEGVSG